MRVLHLLNRMNDSGNGIANVALDLSWWQAGAGDDVHVACGGGTFVPLLREHGVTVHDLDLSARSARDVVATARRLRALVQAVDPEVVHSHVIAGTALGRVAVRRPVVATVHNEYQRGVALMGLAHHVVGVSGAVTESMRRRGVPRRKLTTVRNGVVGSPRRSRAVDEESGELPAGRHLMALGAVSHRKGSDLLLEAFGTVVEQCPDVHLHFIGNLDWAALGERAERAPYADHVHFAGYRRNPAALLESADVFVLPSRRDPYPLALLEAMEVGVAIVGAAVDGVPEALGGGEHGVLVPPDDAPALARALLDLLHDPARARELAQRARVRAQDFTVETMAGQYRRVYESLL